MAELFKQLESNDLKIYSEAKQRFFEQFNTVKDSWLLNGVYDYYLQSSSTRAMEVLVNITEQHFIFLCDKLIDSIRSSKNNAKMQALTLLGFIVRKEPTWLIKVTHSQNMLVKELLKLLKTETDVLPLLSALLVIIVLLPIFPAWMGQNHLKDLLDIFSRLAAFNISNPGKVSEEQMVHMQMALFSLFQRLYGMYPCNFIAFLRTYYRNKEMSPIFMHTIKPMIATVKMHPLLITFSTDHEISNDRWKKMVPHDVIVECERYNIKTGEICSNDSCVFAATTTFRSRSGTNPPSYETSQLQVLKGAQMRSINTENFFSPSMILDTQPPIESPVILGQDSKAVLRNFAASNASRAITSFGKTWSSQSGLGTPSNSQPSSPMRKDSTPFTFPVFEAKPHSSAFGYPKKDSSSAQKIQKLLQERDRIQISSDDKKVSLVPSSPLRIIPSSGNDNNSPVIFTQRNDSPISQEDEEVLAIVGQTQSGRMAGLRQCDSVLHDVEEGRAMEEEMDSCELENGSPCTEGGLHMPNSSSMSAFAKRLRYYSQCAAETEKIDKQSTESSPGKPASLTATTVRRANSCPEIKKGNTNISKDNLGKVLPETAEEGGFLDDNTTDRHFLLEKRILTTRETQTDVLFPMPYEHLFLSIYPSIESGETLSEAQANIQEEPIPDEYEVLDKFFSVAINAGHDNAKSLKEQLQLLHQRLLFEKHQREIASYRIRRLLSEAKNNKSLEEYNSALRDQIQLQQREIDSLRIHEMKLKTEKACMEQDRCKLAEELKKHIDKLKEEVRALTHKNKNLKLELESSEHEKEALNKVVQTFEHRLMDAEANVKVASEQVSVTEKAKNEIIILNRELLLTREHQIRLQERFNDLTYIKNHEEESRRLSTAHKTELKSLQNLLNAKKSDLESHIHRVSELEMKIASFEEEMRNQKKFENELKEQHDEKLKALETKYKAQLAINRKMEENILELWQKIELATKKPYHSPDISSCQEANTSNMIGQTQPPTPLSASLASSDGAFMSIDPRDVRNLQQMTEKQSMTASEEANGDFGSSATTGKID